jgi:aryl-alcohol dehydrogenase-like predicted oxidoreductase
VIRIALGCMRLSTDDDRDEARAAATIRAALDAGVRVFDTARAYARDDTELGHNERLLAGVLRERRATDVRVVTKGGMRRPRGAWEPDGRARTLRADCEASLEALDGLCVDLFLLHAPDRRVAWATSVRTLAGLVEAGLVRRVGLSNVTRRQLDEALALAPIAAVQVPVGPFADAALRGGVVGRCLELGIEVLAHSPLGGPERAGRLDRHAELAAVAARHGVSAQRIALEALADLHPSIVPVVGARRPETVRSCTTPLALGDADRAALEARYGWRAILHPPAPAAFTGAELVLVMGVQGAGKSTAAQAWEARGYERMNRDGRGGSMKDLQAAIDAKLAASTSKLVADNTYCTRATRQAAIAAARRLGAQVTGVWLETPVAEAQRNVILRMLAAHGRLLEPEEMERARTAESIGPGALWRLLRDVEPPAVDEGFTRLEIVPFARRPRDTPGRAATFVALDAVDALDPARLGVDSPGDPRLVFGWTPGATAERTRELQARFGTRVLCCPHAAGAARCWCRPPLPGLLLALAESHGVDVSQSAVVGTSEAHERMARAIGAAYRRADGFPRPG